MPNLVLWAGRCSSECCSTLRSLTLPLSALDVKETIRSTLSESFSAFSGWLKSEEVIPYWTRFLSLRNSFIFSHHLPHHGCSSPLQPHLLDTAGRRDLLLRGLLRGRAWRQALQRHRGLVHLLLGLQFRRDPPRHPGGALRLQTRAPVSWKNFPITFASYAALFCLSASILFPLYYLKGSIGQSETRDYRIVSTVFSCLATIAYISEVSLSKARPGEVAGYMATAPGLLKVCETFVACIIFVFVSDPVTYDRYDALKYCMSVYCICFILSAVIILLCIGECTGCLPFPFARFLSAYALLAVVLYLSATIIWPIFNFDPKNGGTKNRPSNCSNAQGLCLWDKNMAVSVLTGVNFVLYLVDLIYSSRLVFVNA
ncbi:hypothetical protein F7725_011132 [Dissostichus mawsoni]|uniref:MARVEL domain-containing protein n=1 Tax=Dissostichus mawsoni TaxID=36200 RepID=A0A7J5Z9T7_DISMA|nr:hypothetical protein F7725_011132 [Dissostichus mawsoni]